MASQISGYIGKLNPGNGTEYSLGSTAYGICSTAAGTVAKTVDMTGFTLITGATIFVKFTNANSATNPTLNVNSTGAKALLKYGSSSLSWQAGAVLCLTYDGTSWIGNSVTLQDLGLSNAMHFIGKATVAITDGGTENPTITGYDFTNDRKPGDVIIDKDNGREYVWTIAGAWEILGRDASTTFDSGAAQTNKWISRLQQDSAGNLTATIGELDTSGTWSGNATTATTASKLSNTSKIGDTNKPVYFTANGVPAAINYTIDATVDSGTANRMAYYDTSHSITSAGHYVDDDKVSIGSTNAPATDEVFYVSGNSRLKGILIQGSSSITNANVTGDHAAAFNEASAVTGQNATAFGYHTTASGSESIAFNGNTTASGDCSAAFGYKTSARGEYSFAEGEGSGDTTVTFSGAANATSYTSTAEISSNALNYFIGYTNADVINLARITSINGTTFTTDKTLSSTALTNASGIVYRGVAYGKRSHVEGAESIAFGKESHAEGDGSAAIGDGSHAEGGHTQATGKDSHAEGYYASASGQYSHAEGRSTVASGEQAHAAGRDTIASAANAHAEGIGTIARGNDQYVFGRYNVQDSSSGSSGVYVEIVGKGTADNDRSNARTLDWSGNETLAGNLLPMGTEQNLGSSSYKWAKLYIGTTDSYGSNVKGIYWDNGVPTEMTHSLNATVNAGTANQVAYYSDANTIDSMAPAWQPWTAGSTNGPQANIQIGNAIYQSAAIPSATATDSGIVTTVAQTFAGDKTFQGNVFPAVSDSYNLGSTALRWKFLYGVRGIDLTNGGATGITVNNTNIVHSSSYKVDAVGLAGIYDDSHSFWVLSTDQPYGDTWLKSKANRNIVFERNGTENARFDTAGHFIPGTTETFNLGSTAKKWNDIYNKLIYADYYMSSSDITSRLTSLDFSGVQRGGAGKATMRIDLVSSSITDTSIPPSGISGRVSAGYALTFNWDTADAMSQLYIPNGDHIGTRNGPQGLAMRGYDSSSGTWTDWVSIPTLSAFGTANRIAYFTGPEKISSGSIVTDGSYLDPGTNNTGHLGSAGAIWNGIHTYYVSARHLDAAAAAVNSDSALYIGWGAIQPTKATKIYYSADTSSRTEFFEVNSNGAYALTRFGVNGQNTSYNLYVNGTSLFTNAVRIQYGGKPASLYLYDNSNDTSTHSIIRLGAATNENGAYIWLNGPSRTADGGANTLSIRNNVGYIRLNNVVHVGTESKKGGLRVYGAFNYTATGETFDTNDRPSLTISGSYPQIWLMSNANNTSHGATITLGGMATADATSGDMSAFTIESSGAYAPTNLTIGYGTNANPHYNTGISSGYGTLIMRLTSAGRVGILTASPSYPLHVTGDMYTSGWARAASGFYCHDTGVHYTHNGNHGEINITKSNEMIISGNANTLYINYRAASRGTLVTTFRFHGGSSTTYAKLVTGGLDVWGHVAADTGTAGYGANSGGGYHNAYNNIILHGHDTSGSSGILFISGKGTTTINQPSDRAFIQFHPYGVTAAAEGTAPTIGTSGENNRLVIGVGNDATDQIWLQAPAHTGLIHQLGATSCVIPDTGNATGTVGSATVPVYVNGGVITQGSYALNSTVNAGTANYMAYYSGANAISATSGARISTNTNLSIWPSGSSPNYSHGIRIHSLSSWSGILFCGDDCTADTGTSANSWWVGNNNGTFYINKNGSTAAANTRAMATSTGWTFGNTSRNSYALNCASFICDSWVRTVGSAGWYSESYGGGWYMSDSTWIRSHNNKSVYSGSGTIRSDNAVWGNKVTLQGDWVGFYSAAGSGTRYGYVQANANRMYFRKENGVSSYHFDFNGHLYTTGTYYTTAQPGVYVTVSSGQWAYVRLHNSSAYWDIATNNAASGTAPANSLGFRYNGGNPSAAAGVWITPAQVLMGAAWNDYAEYRETKEEIEPGRCVKEIGDDTLEITTKRLERGCEIVSDTYGFVIGKTEKCQTPIASSGRVLAYGYESREEFASHIGWPVCSGPDGTVSIMTEEEEEKYPSRIIGTISAVPDYEEWGTGNVKVNGRVWIRIR